MTRYPVAEPVLGEEEKQNVLEALESGWISSAGKFVRQFESDFSSYCGREHGIAVSNGTAALHLALEALGIGKGDEVIVPDLSFVAIANAVLYCNAKPVFVGPHPDYWCMDPGEIEEKITVSTKAVIPVHLYGHPCDMDRIIDIADDADLFVLEDAAEAHGARYQGKRVGGFGHISCFSFYGNKIMTTGEGGACLTDDVELAERMRILRDHGMDPGKRYWHEVVGFNYRMTNIQAAMGVAQLGKLDGFIEKKRRIAGWYGEYLGYLADQGKITLHPEMDWAECVFWMYSVLIEEGSGMERDELIRELELEGIETRPFFHSISMMPPYREYGPGGANRAKGSENNENAGNKWNDGSAVKDLSTEISGKGINLPSSASLTRSDIEHIAQKCIQFIES